MARLVGLSCCGCVLGVHAVLMRETIRWVPASMQLLLNCEEAALKAMARRWPPLLELDMQELQHRLVALKVCWAPLVRAKDLPGLCGLCGKI